MTMQQTPPFARSDVKASPTTSTPARRPFAAQGHLLSAGAAAWALSTAAYGLDPEGSTAIAVQAAGSGLFQIGLLGLLVVLYRTHALGEGRLARFFIRFESVLVTLAIGSTLADGFGVSDLDTAGWAVLDAFWPFSMMGMFLIGIRIAVAGRWQGASRFWPMVAESWAVVVIPTLGIFGTTAAAVVAVVHLLVGYTVLGQLVARKSG